VIPADALLGIVEREILVGEHVRGVVGLSRVQEKQEGMADQRAQRGIDMPLVVQSRKSLHDIFEEG
jgi:hypothetical protein